MIVLMAGLPGTGKSTLAHALAEKTGGAVIGKDKIRAALFSAEDIEYSTEQDDFCMEIMLETARYVLQKNAGRLVFLDGRTFSREYQIMRALETAKQLGQAWRILECTCSDATAQNRLRFQSASREHIARNRDLALYAAVKERFEEIRLPKTLIDADQPLQHCITQALDALRT